MKMFDFSEINERIGDVLAFATGELGLSPVKGNDHFNIPWRAGSDSGALHIFAKGWKDHISGDTGTGLDLYVRCRNIDIWAAQVELGERFGLKEKGFAKEKRHVIKEYVYETLDGTPLHKTLRYEPKDFSQVHWDAVKGVWEKGLKDIEPILYKMREWLNAKYVLVVGGEKDVDNALGAGLPATTNALGEGHWRESYNAHFKGKRVIIVPDNDKVGRLHAQIVAWNLKDIATEIRVVTLPGVNEKGDLSDWLAAGGTKEKFIELAKNFAPLTEFVPPEKSEDIKELSEAKRANSKPFRNFRAMEIDMGGTKKTERQPVHINELIAEVFKRFWGFPRAVGSSLFDHDRKTGRIRFLESPSELFAWIQEKSGHPVQWAMRGEGFVTQTELYSAIHANCKQYEMISGVPNWPPREDVYYTHSEMPKPTPDAKFFNEFCAFFCPAATADATLIKMFFASPLYYRLKIDRPLWIIDSSTGQGSGKTKLVEIAAQLYGGEDLEQGEPIWAEQSQVSSEQMIEVVKRRLLSRSGRKKRVFLIDNVTGYFRSNALASMVTQGSLSGIAPYGKGEETRPNDLTYVITSNSASVNRDLSARALVVWLAKPETPLKDWERAIQTYIKVNRLQIIADIIGILERGTKFEIEPSTRFRGWEREIMQPICENEDIYQSVLKTTNDRRSDSDGEAEDAETVRSIIIENLKKLDTPFNPIDPAIDPVFIENDILRKWIREAIPGFGGLTGQNVPHILKNWIKTNTIQELSLTVTRYPRAGKRGLSWNIPQGWSLPFKVVSTQERTAK